MINKRFFLLVIFTVLLSNFSYAQKWIISPVELFEEPSKYSKPLGVLLRSAKVDILSGYNNKEFYKVRVDNEMEGYVKKSFIVSGLYIYDNYELSPHPIIENDGHYGSPHLFVTVASLRGRTKPSIRSKVGRLFTMGKVVGVNFYPYNSESWVNVGNYFVQQKYLGARPILEDIYKQFDEIPIENIKKRKQIGQRMIEFVWRSGKPKAPAYERYLTLAKQLKDKKLIRETLLYIEKIKGDENRLSYEEIQAIEKSNKNFIMLNGIRFNGYDLSLNKLMAAKGEPIKKIKEENECCYIGDTRYVYKDAEFIVDEKKGVAEIDWFSLQSKGNSYHVNGFKIDSDTSKDEFVKSLSRIFQFSGLYPKSYDFPFLDYASISVSFKTGRPDRFNFSIWP